MIYVDTSVLIALVLPEPHSANVARWYAQTQGELVSAQWCISEFASALGIKQRTGQIDAVQAQDAWQRFERLTLNDLVLLPVVAADFHHAATFALDASTALRAGGALHLACAERAGASDMATLDAVLGRGAERLQIGLVVLS